MSIRLIVLNGASSSGKSGLARCLQAVLPQPWLTCGVDTFIQMMPAAMQASESGIEVAADGTVSVAAVRCLRECGGGSRFLPRNGKHWRNCPRCGGTGPRRRLGRRVTNRW